MKNQKPWDRKPVHDQSNAEGVSISDPEGAAGNGKGWVRPMQPLTDAPPRNLDEALRRLRMQQPPHRYADHVASAINRMGNAIGKPLDRIPTDPPVLRQLIVDALPANAKMGNKRWRRVCSLVSTYLRSAGVELEPGRDTVGHTEAWRQLLSEGAKDTAVAISRFVSFCSRNGVEPAEVTADTFAAFGEAMRQRSLKERPEAIIRNAVTQWNRAVSASPSWPQVVIPQARHERYYSLPWSAYPDSFQKDVEAYLSKAANPRVFSADYKRPVRPSTTALRRRQLRLVAALLVESGFPIEKLTSLEVLSHPDNALAACERHVVRKGETTHSLVQICGTLARLAQDRLHDPAQVQLLRAFAVHAGQDRRHNHGPIGMTKRNKDELRQFDLAQNRKALLNLPDRVFAEAAATPLTRKTARRVMLAMAIELLLACAFRGANLVQLEIDRHFKDIRDGRSTARYLIIPAAEMKGNEDYEVPLPERTRLLLDEYLTIYWPLLAPEGSLFLFPGKAGQLKDKIHFAQVIVAFILQETGLKMHLHLFRHLAAKMHFDRHPGDVETARRFLMHKSRTTLLTHYVEPRTDKSFASYHQTLHSERSQGGRHASRL